MTTYNLDTIDTANHADDLLIFKKSVSIDDQNVTYDFGYGKSQLYLHSLNIGEEEANLRDLTKYLTVGLVGKWSSQEFHSILERTVLPVEKLEELITIRIYCLCTQTCWCSVPVELPYQKNISDTKIQFKIDLDQVSDKITIETVLVRNKNSNPSDLPVATKKDSILGTNKAIDIYVDEPRVIGADFLPIEPKDLKDSLFEIGSYEDPTVMLPPLQYNSQFEKFFKSDSYDSVSLILYGILPYYIEMLLKKMIFKGGYEEGNKQHQALLEYVSDLSDVDISEIKEIIVTDELKLKIDLYMDVSIKIFRNIQNYNGLSFLKVLRSALKNEQHVR